MIQFNVHLSSNTEDGELNISEKEKQDLVFDMMDAITNRYPDVVLLVGEEIDIPLTKDLLLNYGFEKTRHGYDYNKGELILEEHSDGKIVDSLDNGAWITLNTQKDLFDYYRILHGKRFIVKGTKITHEGLMELGFRYFLSADTERVIYVHPSVHNVSIAMDSQKVWRLLNAEDMDITNIDTIQKLKYQFLTLFQVKL